MTFEEIDPLARKAQADLVIERAAEQLRRILHHAASALRPFPPFPGAFFTNAIEAEPDAAAGAQRGCVVVCEDGELYELQIGMDFDSIALTGFEDPVSLRKEELHKLDLHPRDYLVYAYNAISAVTEQLLEQSESEP
ncbi:MAG: hypothetical protein ACR2PL_21770 [Dehalococcoidia bacterium]